MLLCIMFVLRIIIFTKRNTIYRRQASSTRNEEGRIKEGRIGREGAWYSEGAGMSKRDRVGYGKGGTGASSKGNGACSWREGSGGRERRE
jgi:hypothetical protein